MKNVLVKDIMTRSPFTISPDTNLLNCAKIMVKKKVGSLLIVDKKNLVGFISEKDILWALVKKSKNDLSKIRAIDISPRKIATIQPSATIKEAIEKMKKTKFERFPVVQNQELLGIVTIKDILNFHPEVYPEIEEFSRIREEADKLRRIEKAKESTEGRCEKCGNEDSLYEYDGLLICNSCRSSI